MSNQTLDRKTPLAEAQLAEIEARNDKLYNLYNTCAKSGLSWHNDSLDVANLMHHLDAEFPGNDVALLLKEVRRLREANAQSSFVYVVTAFSGQHSDRDEWIVACYLDRETAEQHCELAREGHRRVMALPTEEWDSDPKNPYDRAYSPTLRDDATFEVVTERLFRHVDEYLEKTDGTAE
jgi:hypothetical protein